MQKFETVRKGRTLEFDAMPYLRPGLCIWNKKPPGLGPGGVSTLASVASGEINLLFRLSSRFRFRLPYLCPREQRPHSRLFRTFLLAVR